MAITTAIMGISILFSMLHLFGKRQIAWHSIPMVMVRYNHRQQRQDACHKHHVPHYLLFNLPAHSANIYKINESQHNMGSPKLYRLPFF